MIYLVAFVVLVLATARLTRLIHFDDITIPVRMWIDRKFGEQSFLSQLVWCPWCVSVWVSLGTSTVAMTALWHWGGWPLGGAMATWLLLVPATAYPAGWIVTIEIAKTSRGE